MVVNKEEGRTGSAKTNLELPELMRPPEVARALGISSRTVLRLLYEGKLKGVKLGHLWMVPKAELQSFLQNLLAKSSRQNAPEDDK